MSIFQHLIQAIRNIRANKLRATLSSLGIIIGVSSVIIMLAFGEGTTRSITKSVQSLGSNTITLVPGSANKSDARKQSNIRSQTEVFRLNDLSELEKIQYISSISPVASTTKQVVYKIKNTSSTITGVSSKYASVNNIEMAFGSFISDQNISSGDKVAVLGSKVVTTLFDGANPLGVNVRIGDGFFRVIGVTVTKGSAGPGSDPDNTVFIPLSTAQKRVIGNEYLSSIAVTIDKDENMEIAKDIIMETLLGHFGIAKEEDANFQLFSSADTAKQLASITGTLKVFLGGIAAISLIVGGIGVMNIMLVSVSERTREIGIRRCIGALDSDIILQFLLESIVLTSIGGFIGFILSYSVVNIIVSTGFEAYITPSTVGLALFSTIATGVIFGITPAYKASKLKPIDALRSE